MDIAAPKLLNLTGDAADAVAAQVAKLDEIRQTVVATSQVPLYVNDPVAVTAEGTPVRIVRNAETNLGDLCADAYRALSNADIAFVNGGGIRKQIEAGDITLDDIYSVHPFGNTMCVIRVTGQQVLDALEWGARAVPSENGGFLQVSGLTYEIHTGVASSAEKDENGMFTRVSGEYRVKNVMVGGQPLELDKTYTLASHNYMLLGHGDGYTMFDGCEVLGEDMMVDNQVLITYITTTLGGVVGEQYANPYGDGRIVAMRTDGTSVNTVITNNGGAAFLDPFIGCVYNGNIYYTDRNTGISAISELERGAVQGKKSSTERDSYFVQNNLLPYYGRGLAYGSISCGLYRDKAGYWWWAKKYNGEGIFRFNDSQIYATQADAEKAQLPGPIVLSSQLMTTFTIDEDRQMLYVWRRMPESGFLAYKLPSMSDRLQATDKPEAYVAMEADPVNTTASEGVHTTQFAVDKENGRVYFCFRPDAADNSGVAAGINYFDPADNKVHKYGTDNDLGTGIVINPNKTKLF